MKTEQELAEAITEIEEIREACVQLQGSDALLVTVACCVIDALNWAAERDNNFETLMEEARLINKRSAMKGN